MADKHVYISLNQITAGKELYGLDSEGRVWKYSPSSGTKKALWSRLTAHGIMWVSDETEKDKND